jgi:hypothetical protein
MPCILGAAGRRHRQTTRKVECFYLAWLEKPQVCIVVCFFPLVVWNGDRGLEADG